MPAAWSAATSCRTPKLSVVGTRRCAATRSSRATRDRRTRQPRGNRFRVPHRRPADGREHSPGYRNPSNGCCCGVLFVLVLEALGVALGTRRPRGVGRPRPERSARVPSSAEPRPAHRLPRRPTVGKGVDPDADSRTACPYALDRRTPYLGDTGLPPSSASRRCPFVGHLLG